MEGLMLSELKENNVYRCQISGCKVLVAHKPAGESSVKGLYFYEGSFMAMDVRDGQLVETPDPGLIQMKIDKAIEEDRKSRGNIIA